MASDVMIYFWFFLNFFFDFSFSFLIVLCNHSRQNFYHLLHKMVYMNSEWLQKTHKKVYQEFFQHHDLVLSVPHLFRWWPSLSRDSGMVSIKQQLPARIYAWVSSSTQSWVHIRDISMYSYGDASFHHYQAYEVLGQKEINLLESFLADFFSKEWFSENISLSFLSEHPRWYWFWFFGSLVACISSIVHVISKKWFYKHIEQSFLLSDSDFFASVCDMACHIEQYCMKKWSWLHPYLNLLRTKVPACRIWSKIMPDNADIDIESNELSYWLHWLFTLDRLFDQEFDIANLPIDFGILSLWVQHQSHNGSISKHSFGGMFRETSRFLDVLCNKHDVNIDSPDEDALTSLDTYLYTSVLYAIQQTIDVPWSGDLLIQSIKNSWLYHTLIEKEQNDLMMLYHLFAQLQQSKKEDIGFTPISSTKDGWTYLFACHRERSRVTLEKLLDAVQAEWYTQAQFVHLPWRDWYWSQEGLVIDQYISEGSYSSFVQAWSVLFLWWNGSCYVDNHETILWKESQWIVLDAIYSKIYLDGTRLTHKDLQSQSTTVDVVSRLLDADGEYVSNASLPVSSYMKNKNEMLGKIILPFARLVKKSYDIDLDLECSGSFSSFQMRLRMGRENFIHRVQYLHQ